MKWKFHNFTIILVHAHMEEKDELAEHSCYDKLNQLHHRIPAHNTKIVVGVSNAKTEREYLCQWYGKRACMKNQMKMGLEQFILPTTTTTTTI